MANGTMAFANNTYKKVTPFIEVPPGNYEFRFTQAGVPTNELGKITNFPVMDGKLYTLYSYGIGGRVDSARFGANVLINK